MNLCSNPDDKLQIYRDNFEKAYMDSTERFYRTQAPAYLQQNGVQNYMKYVSRRRRRRCCRIRSTLLAGWGSSSASFRGAESSEDGGGGFPPWSGSVLTLLPSL